jgi:energy-coupling factor transporter ATP-binding protein EcfA2
MATLEITVQRKSGDTWPVVLERTQAGELPLRAEGELIFGAGWREELLTLSIDPLAYGTVLGKALFTGAIRDTFVTARSEHGADLRTLLVVEDVELKPLHWERLCAPIRTGGNWGLLGRDQRSIFSLYLPSLADRRFRAIGRRDLRALVLIANPPAENPYDLDCFDEPATVAAIGGALGNLPYDLLASAPEAVGRPTLDELVARITGGSYSLLHIVAHGQFDSSRNETFLYLLDATGQVAPVTATRFVERLDELEGAQGLPRLAFLATCESAAPEAERAGALGGLAQRLVRDLGLPAVVAMTEKVSLATASTLAREFYVRLRDHGEADQALVQAVAALADAGDITVPALYSRLAGRPLFSDTPDRDLTESEIAYGLNQLESLLPERAPELQKQFSEHAEPLRKLLPAGREFLSETAGREWDETLSAVNTLSEEILDLSFPALALGKAPPRYDSRCPFPGLLAFGVRFATNQGPDDRQFFTGREPLVHDLVVRLSQHPFLAVLGSSGSGKSSLVLAGLISALERNDPSLSLAYITPGDAPVKNLEAISSALESISTVLVVDQFEELFTLTTSLAARQQFVQRLLHLAQDRRVVLTMRADFWGDCALYPALAAEMVAHQVLIGPMSSDELRRAMEEQARAVGLRFEADLANTILDAVEDEPGAMPLLQHLLLELWKRRHGRWLRASEYRAMGGIREAIAHTANSLYASLTSEQDKLLVRNIFIRLTRLAPVSASEPARPNTRQRVTLKSLVPEDSNLDTTRTIVNRLADARLVFVNANQVEVTHEALIRYWPALQSWLAQDEAAIALRQTVQSAAAAWSVSARPDLLNHHRDQLKQALNLRNHPSVRLSALEVRYLDLCRRQAQSYYRITIHRGTNGAYPVSVEYMHPDTWLPGYLQGLLHLSGGTYEDLQLGSLTSREYGVSLGRALFNEELYFSFVQAWALKVDQLRVILTVEDQQLQLLHWEKLNAPLNNGWWDFLSTTSIYSLNYHATSDYPYQPISPQNQRALLVIAFPVSPQTIVPQIDPGPIAENARSALAGVACDLLGRVAGSLGPATVDELCRTLIARSYSIVHIVAHGYFDQSSRSSGLLFEDTSGSAVPVSGDAFVDTLGSLKGRWVPPQFLYLDAGNSSSLYDHNEHGRLGPRLVTELGIPAVLAMTRELSLATSQALSRYFYLRFLEHGEPDRALAEARELPLPDHYSFVPFVYSRLFGKSLFAEAAAEPARSDGVALGVTITVHSRGGPDESWPVTTVYETPGRILCDREMSSLALAVAELSAHQDVPSAYGLEVSQALLTLRAVTSISESAGASTRQIRVQLAVETPELQSLHWEWLSWTMPNGTTRYLASLPGVQLSQLLFSPVNQSPTCLECAKLKALSVISYPSNLRPATSLPLSELLDNATGALSGYSHDVLIRGETNGSGEPPTLQALYTRLDTTQYAILQLVTRVALSATGDVMVGLETEAGEVEVVRLQRLIERLDAARYVPQCLVLISPNTVRNSTADALSRLAQALVESTGVLAAVAMGGLMSQTTTWVFATVFYRQLRTHGFADRAFNEACVDAGCFSDFVPPAFFTRLKGQALFYNLAPIPTAEA